MMYEAGDSYVLDLLCGLASADGAALPCFGLETLVLPFLALHLPLTWMGSDSLSDSDPIRSLGAGDSAHAGAGADGVGTGL